MVTMVTSTGEKAEVFYGALWGGGEKHTARTHVGSNKLRGVDHGERFEVQDTTGLLAGVSLNPVAGGVIISSGGG